MASSSSQSHLNELKRKHQVIDHEIREASMHPGTDTGSITELKRRKLSLKDRIDQIERTLH